MRGGLREDFVERQFENGVFGAQNRTFEFLQAAFGRDHVDVVRDWVERPNVSQSHCEMFVDAVEHIQKTVCGGENLDI